METYSDPAELYLGFAEFIAQGKNSQRFFGEQSFSHTATQIMYQDSQSYRSVHRKTK